MKIHTKAACLILAMMLTACSTPHFMAIEQTAVGKAPSVPYKRLYVLANFNAADGWIAKPLADSLNQALSASGKIVASEFQLIDEIALAPGPNLKRARGFKPDGTLICRLVSMQRIVSGGFGGSAEIECDLYDSVSGARVWFAKERFAPNGEVMKQTMDGIAGQFVQHLTSLKFI